MAGEFQVDDLSDAVDTLSTGLYTVTRPSAVTTFLKGMRVAPATSTFEIRAMIHPEKGRAVDRLPEGLRSHEMVAIITKTELRGALAGVEPDLVTYDGRAYQVQIVERWKPSGNFYRAYATQVPSR